MADASSSLMATPMPGATDAGMAAAPPEASSAPAPAPLMPHELTMEELENTVRNGKKKLYWSAFEVVLATTLPSGEQHETRYDAYQVNHNHLKKIHAGSRGASYVRVECKYCKSPRFTQSITVSTKKFEEHYMTLHALDALASADAKKAAQHKKRKASAKSTSSGDDDDDEEGDDVDSAEADDDVVMDHDAEEDDGRARNRTRRVQTQAAKRHRRGALTKDDDDHVAAMQGAAAAVVALSGGHKTDPNAPANGPMPVPTLPSSVVDSSVVLDPADSDTKRAKKVYWTAYEVVICERVRATQEGEEGGENGEVRSTEFEVRETRQDAWRVNHNALRRLHLDPSNDTTVRVECRFCDEPKFSQSITVSTRKFEQHYYYEHGDEKDRVALEEKMAARVAASVAHATRGVANSSQADGAIVTDTASKRRKSWKALLMERENESNRAAKRATSPAATATAVGSAYVFPPSGRHAATRQQRALLLDWLLHDCIPLSTLDSEHFRAFATALDRKFETPLPHVIRSQLAQRFDVGIAQLKRCIQEECEAGTQFSLTVDEFPVTQPSSLRASSAMSMTFLSVTLHFISHQWQRQQLLIACRPVAIVNGSQASIESIRDVLLDVLVQFCIPATQILSVTTRHQALMGEAAKSLLAPALPKKTSPPFILHCAADALNAIAQAGYDALMKVGTSSRALVDSIPLQSSAPLDWMQAFTAAHEAMRGLVTGAHSLQPIVLANAVSSVLDPFVRVAEDVSRASYPIVPMVFQYYRLIKDTLQQQSTITSTGSSDQDEAEVKEAVSVMQKRMNELYDRVLTIDAMVAYVLDPRFRFTHVSVVHEKRIRARIELAIATLHGANNNTDVERNEDSSASTPGSTQSVGDAATAGANRPPRSLFEELATSGRRTSVGSTVSSISGASSSATSTTSTSGASPSTAAAVSLANAELDTYLDMEDEDFSVDVLQWWQSREVEFPTLSRIARQYLGVVGTCLPAQEAFTIAGQRLAAQRSLLEPEFVEMTLVTRSLPPWATSPVTSARSKQRPAAIPTLETPAVNDSQVEQPEAETQVPSSGPTDKGDLAFVV